MMRFTNLSYLMMYRFINLFLGELIQKIIPIIIYLQTDSLKWLGISFAATWLPRVLLQPFFGVIIDKIDIKYVFWGSDFFRAAILIPLFWVSDPYILSLIGAIFGLAAGFSYMGIEYAISHSLGIDRTTQVQSKIQNSEQLAIILAPILAGFLASSSWLNFMLLVTILGYIVPPILFGSILQKSEQNNPSNQFVFNKIYTGISEVFSKKRLLILTATTAMMNLMEGIIVGIIPAVILGKFYQEEYIIGIVFSLGSFFSVCTLMLMSSIKELDVHICRVLGLVLVLLGVLFFGNSTNLLLCIMGYIILIIGRVLFVVYMRIERSHLIPKQNFSTTLGVFLSLILLPMPISGIVISQMNNILLLGYITNILAIVFFIIAFVPLIKRRKSS